MENNKTTFVDDMRTNIVRRSEILRREYRVMATFRSIIFSLAIISSGSSVAFAVCSIARTNGGYSEAVMGQSLFKTLGTVLFGAGLGWVAHRVRLRQEKLDSLMSREAEIQYLVACALLIEDPVIRAKTTSQIAILAAQQAYELKITGRQNRVH